MLTTPALIQFLQLREGFRKHAYDDAQPNVRLTADTEIKGTITIGYGTTRYPDGTPVEWNDKVTKSEAVDYLAHYIRETIEPALENLIHVPLAGCQYDALGSNIYQFGESEVAGWNLIRLINSGAPWEDIAREWINGTVMWRGEPLFWGRRVMEWFMFAGLPWEAGQNVPVLSDILDATKLMGFDGQLPKPDPIVDEDLFKELEIPPMKKQVITDPTPETPITTADANWMQLESLKHPDRPIVYADFDTSRAVTTQRNKIQTPKVDLKKPPKPMEDSKTHRGLAKRTSGRDDAWIGGVIAGASTMAGTASGISKDVSTITKNTQTVVGGATLHQLMIFGLIIGGGLLLYGLWKMFRGETIAREGREEADVLKV